LLTTKGFAPKQILLFTIGIALLGFICVAVPSLHSVVESDRFPVFLVVGIFSGIFASFGHWADFEAIKHAPNPGYATSIRNCSVLPVTILSVFLFNSEFGFPELMGALLILAGIMALVIERKTPIESNESKQPNSNIWILLAFMALTCYTLTVFGMKKATLLGFSPPEICLCIYIVNFIFFTVICRKEFRNYFRDKARLKFFLPIAFTCGCFAFAVNLLNVKGIQLAPNPGYHEAIKNTNVLLVTFLAIPLFSTRIDKQKLMGVLLTLAGITVLVV
jgi:drug/metabolite transporter (DMT)-like permease